MADNDTVGYGKPPRQTRFRKGQSGNPAGRPRGSRNLKTDLQAELVERISIKENEQPLTISKQRALVKTLMAKALKGDTRAANLVLTMVSRLLEQEVPATHTADLAAEDRAILDDFLRRGSQSNDHQGEP